MKKKVNFCDGTLWKDYKSFLGTFNVFTSFLFIFISIPEQYKYYVGVSFAFGLVALYVYMWCRANKLQSIILTINNSQVTIKIGDLFQENALKVIPFNEYFDTIVDESIIASSSLNGKFIKQHIKNVNEFNDLISDDKHLVKCRLEKNDTRMEGKQQKYRPGSVYVYDTFLLTAFSKFDDDNRACLTMSEYINCLLNFWNEVDIVYANRGVSMPLLGTGITRFTDYEDMSEQEKLELLLWSFRMSRIKFKYPAELTILIHESLQDKINFYKLKEF